MLSCSTDSAEEDQGANNEASKPSQITNSETTPGEIRETSHVSEMSYSSCHSRVKMRVKTDLEMVADQGKGKQGFDGNLQVLDFK